MKKLFELALFSILMLIGSCATKTQIEATYPAANPAAASLRRIAVTSFDGRYGDAFASGLRTSLSQASADDRLWFQIVDAAAARPGVVDAIYTGEVLTADIEKESYTEERERCTKWQTIFDCDAREKYIAQCTRARAQFVVAPRVVAVETGAVVYSRSSSGESEASWCDEDDYAKRTDAELIGEAMTFVIESIRRDVAPYSALVSVELMEQATGLSGTDIESFNNALAFAKSGRMDRACGGWQEIAIAQPNNLALIYNLGVCAETQGDFQRALELYQQADALSTKPDRSITDGLNRARRLDFGQRFVN